MSGVEVSVEDGSGAGVDGPELKEETVDSRFSLILRNMLVDALARLISTLERLSIPCSGARGRY